MAKLWGVDMSQESINRLKLYTSLTPALEAEGWRPMESAPHNGTEIELRVVHINAAYEEHAVELGWIAACRGSWTDFNGGGWTWKYLCGSPCQRRPLQSNLT